MLTAIMSKQSWKFLYWKKSVHESCGYSIYLANSFDSKQDKHSFNRGRDCTKNFFEDLKKHALKIINFKEKDMIP